MKFIDKDLVSVQQARILINNAKNAKEIIKDFSQEKLDEMLLKLHRNLRNHFMELAEIFVNETGYGNLYDETELLDILSDRIIEKYEDIKLKVDDNQLIHSDKVNIPLGIVLGILPSTNPLSSAISILYASLKAGNSIILTGDNKVKNSISEFVNIVNEIAENIGYPKGSINSLNVITDLGNKELINSKEIGVIVNSGLNEYNENKNNIKYIYGSNGASPVFIDKTANIEEAIEEIVNSRSFNYGILPAAEQFLIVDKQVINEVKKEGIKNKLYFMDGIEEEKLIKFLFAEGELEQAYIGKPATWLAKMSGFNIPEDIKVLVSEQKYISDRNYYAKELKIPVLVMYVEEDWINGCERCIELLVNDKVGHTLAIYSYDNEVIKRFILTKPVGRILLNTSTSFGGMGINSEIMPSSILGALTCNKGMSAANLSPYDLVYTRSIGKKNLDISIKKETKKDNEENLEQKKLEEVFMNLIKLGLIK